MSFVEFLLEYYIFILAVLIVLIVGVIGYLVDSKNKEKKQDLGVNVANNDTATLEPSKVNIANASGVMDVNNNLNSNNLATNFQGSMIDNGMLNVGNSINNNINSMMRDVYGMANGQNIQPVVSNLGVNMGNEPNNVISVQSNLVNDTMNKQSAMDVNLNNMSNDTMSSNLMYGPQLIRPMGSVDEKNVQNNVQNSVVNSIPIQSVQPLQYQVNEKMSNNAFNLQNQIGVQPVMPVDNPILVSSNNSLSNNVVNSQLDGQNLMMNANNVQVQNSIGMNQSIMSDNSLNYGIPVRNIQDTNVVGYASNNNGSQNDNVVLATEGSKPFDISNMFMNNQ